VDPNECIASLTPPGELACTAVWIVVAALPIGLLIGLISGGDFGSLRDLELKLWPVALPAITLAIVISLDADPPLERFLLPVSLLLFAVVVFANLNVVGMAVIGVGIIANLAPVLLNGDMPVREQAVIDAGIATEQTVEFVELGAGRRFEEPGDLLTSLDARIPIGVLDEVFTFGDLIVILGLMNVGIRLVRPLGRPSESVVTNQPVLDLRDKPLQLPDDDVPSFVQTGSQDASTTQRLPTVVKGSASWDV